MPAAACVTMFDADVAGDVAALDEHLHKIGIVDTTHSLYPTCSPDIKLSDADTAVVLPKLLSHARLHLLYLAEKLQQHLVSPDTEQAPSTSKACLPTCLLRSSLQACLPQGWLPSHAAVEPKQSCQKLSDSAKISFLWLACDKYDHRARLACCSQCQVTCQIWLVRPGAGRIHGPQ